ncbi:hypothetical protein [Oceanobacillus saliphilus]|uniref:hypothetical protein n=1 Tax=Oceanobacillus saliphilus TaxID=2925834 RepID=UPI00201E1911|nr:hypothetical protein [Oceanobacillus saliphilus]
MSYWFFLNFILLILAIYKVVTHFSFPELHVHIILGFIGFMFFLFNWTRNAVFSTIRNIPDRRKKIMLATMSKKVMPFHRWTGMLALLFIFMHAWVIIYRYGFSVQNEKMLSGLLAMITLMLLVATGWMRLIKPTGRLRRLHLRLGMLLFLLLVLHIIL